MKIRDVTEEDLSLCQTLLRIPEFTLADGSYPDVCFLKKYLEPDYFLAAEQNGEIVGCIVGERLKANYTVVWYLAVREDQRGNGLGKGLLAEYERRAKLNGLEWVFLQAPLTFSETVEWYRRCYSEGRPLIEFTKRL